MELQKLADETGLRIAVCHFPPGTSKWNKIEHRLFSEWTRSPVVVVVAAMRLTSRVTPKGLLIQMPGQRGVLDRLRLKGTLGAGPSHASQFKSGGG